MNNYYYYYYYYYISTTNSRTFATVMANSRFFENINKAGLLNLDLF